MVDHSKEPLSPSQGARGDTPKPVDRSRNVVGNTIVLMLVQVSSMAVSILLTPFIVSTLGIERFGLWAFLNAVVLFAGLLEVGLGRGSVRFIAVYGERQQFDVVRRIVSYGMFFRLALGLLLSPLAWVIGHQVLPHTGIPASLVGEAETLLPLVLAYFFLSAGMRLLGALLIAFERAWMVSLITLASQVIYAALVVFFLLEGLELYGLLIALVIQSVIQGVAFFVVARRLIGPVFGNPFAIGRPLLVEMLRFGGWTQVTSLTAFVNRQTDAIIIGSFLSIGTVGLYDIGNRIATLTRTLPLTLLAPLLPTASRIHAQGDEHKIARAVLEGNRLIALMSLGMAGFVLATAPLIMTVWLGRSYPDVALIAVLLTVTYVVNNLTGVGTTIVAAIGRPRYEAEYATIGMILNLGATLALAPIYGLYGIIAGTLFGVVACSIYFLWRFHRLLKLPLWDYLGSWLWRLSAAAIVAWGATYALRTALPGSVLDDRGKGALALIVLGLLYTGVFLFNLRMFRFLETRDLEVIRRILPIRLQGLARRPSVQFLFGARP